MADPVITPSPQAKKFVDDALANANPRVQITEGIGRARYGNSQFLQLRQDCSIGQAQTGAIPVEEVCGLVLEKTADAVKTKAIADDPLHPFALFVNALDHRKYTNYFQGGGNTSLAAAGPLGVDIYYIGGRKNLAKEPSPFSYSIPDARFWPQGATQSPVFRTYKGMAYDSAFTKTTVGLVTTGQYHEDALIAGPGFPKEITQQAAQCFRNSPTISYDECREAGMRHASLYHNRGKQASNKDR